MSVDNRRAKRLKIYPKLHAIVGLHLKDFHSQSFYTNVKYETAEF